MRDRRIFCGLGRSRSDCTERAVCSWIYTVRYGTIPLPHPFAPPPKKMPFGIQVHDPNLGFSYGLESLIADKYKLQIKKRCINVQISETSL